MELSCPSRFLENSLRYAFKAMPLGVQAQESTHEETKKGTKEGEKSFTVAIIELATSLEQTQSLFSLMRCLLRGRMKYYVS